MAASAVYTTTTKKQEQRQLQQQLQQPFWHRIDRIHPRLPALPSALLETPPPVRAQLRLLQLGLRGRRRRRELRVRPQRPRGRGQGEYGAASEEALHQSRRLSSPSCGSVEREFGEVVEGVLDERWRVDLLSLDAARLSSYRRSPARHCTFAFIVYCTSLSLWASI